MHSKHPLMSRRSTLLLGVGSLAALSGCAQMMSGLAPQPRTMQSGAQAHAYQTASFIFAFAQGGAMVWKKTLEKVQADAVPLLEALREGGHEMRLGTKDFDADGKASVTAYELLFTVKSKSGEEHSLPGKPGTDEGAYDAALKPAAEALKIDAEKLKQGHFALYAAANGMTTLNASHDTLQKHAFKLLALRAKIEAGEKADWFDPNRPKEESFADIDEALQLIEDDHQRITRARAGIVALLTLAASYQTDGALKLLEEQIATDKKSVETWLATHERPTAGDYGVKAAALPGPDFIQKQLAEKVGFLGSLAKVAYGVVSANPGKAIEGLAELAPEDSSAKTALEGVSAALQGDVMGAAEAVAELAGIGDVVDDTKGRLDQLKQLRGDAQALKEKAG